MKIFCGIDWAEHHHDVALVDDQGIVVARRRIGDDTDGFRTLLELFTEHGDRPDNPIPVAIETSRGLLVACLRATGRAIYAINPLAASRYRERHSVARAKSDHADAVMLANIVRTDAAAHRRLPADTELVQAIAVLARAGQDAAWNRQQIANQLRSVLREYFPAALEAFQKVKYGLASVEARTVLAAAPTPARARRLTKGQIRKLLVKAGRQRGIDEWVDRLHHLFRTEQLRQLQVVETAFGEQARGLLLQLDAACQAADHLATETQRVFEQHPDGPILTSFPGLGALSGARILGEIGDDRARFTDARNLRAYAGSAPVTRASGKSLVVMQRKVKNQRLAAAGYIWTFAALTASPHARAHYDRRRDAGDGHAAALRNLFNKFLGQLHHCLATGQRYDPNHAFPNIESTATAA
ncbi:transposase (plasmid) [Rhodococcus opacus]|uniref:Transposase n=1 Tax=Rhodococcus opacus TaxID=37919 RepID=A0A076EYL8_RHOOP|nr:transposase [Rhodococcus opacus]